MSSYTALPPALRRVQYDPAADGTVVATAFFETVLTNDADPADRIPKAWVSVPFELPPELAQEILDLATAQLPLPPPLP